eukprot:scaffold87426_cov18-Tisochrysis_lutea.AAC.1
MLFWRLEMWALKKACMHCICSGVCIAPSKQTVSAWFARNVFTLSREALSYQSPPCSTAATQAAQPGIARAVSSCMEGGKAVATAGAAAMVYALQRFVTVHCTLHGHPAGSSGQHGPAAAVAGGRGP